MAIVKSRIPTGRHDVVRRETPGWARVSCATVLLGALAACGHAGSAADQMRWAQAALERNDQLQVVATDLKARTVTVRLKGSGALRVIALDQLVAGPTVSGAPVPSTEPPPTPDTAAAASQPAEPQPPPAAPPTNTASDRGEAPASPGDAAQTESSPAGTAAAEVAGPHAASAVDAKVGSVLASGPGYSIKASGPKLASARPASATARGMPTEHLRDPIICQGARLLHIDNRNLEFDGDALAAEDGCELHITNTRITAHGIGVFARAANVHIENSDIEGDGGAIDASAGAQVYAEASHFKGLNRRVESSAIHDLGGNVWN